MPKCGQKAAVVPNPVRVRRSSVPSTGLAICDQGAEPPGPVSGPRAASAGPDFGPAAHVHRYCNRRWLAAPGCSGVDVFAGSPSRRSVHADRLQRPQRWTHGVLQRARMPESDTHPPHGVQAPVLKALRADKLQRIDRNGRRRRSQGSSHRRRESTHYVDRHPHRPGKCCAQFADAHSVRHGLSGSRATTLPMRLFAHCLTRPSPCRSLARWTMRMRQKLVG